MGGVLEAVAPLSQLLTAAGVVTGLGPPRAQAMAAEAMLFTAGRRSREAARAAGEHDRRPSNDPTRIELWRLRGPAREPSADRPERARAAFERGEEVAASFEAPLDQALLELAYGQFLRKQGSRRLAIATLPWRVIGSASSARTRSSSDARPS